MNRQIGRRIGAIDPMKLTLDVGVAAALVIALAIVFALDQRDDSNVANGSNDRYAAELEVSVREDLVQSPMSDTTLRLAVTEPEYDDMGRLLTSLGIGYQYVQIPLDYLLDPERLENYDVVFLTCGRVPKDWVGRRVGNAARGGTGTYSAKPEIAKQLKRSLRRFLRGGGTLYVSDLHYEILGLAFAERRDRKKSGRGTVQTVQAKVVDRGLAKRLGTKVDLRFDMPGWRPAAFTGPGVNTLISGKYQLQGARETTGPLLITFPFEGGSVIFTSFHNEEQNNETELELLRYLVFTSVTAREESRVKRTMISGGVSPMERNLLSTSSGGKSIRDTYVCETPGRLQFVLGFEGQGARLRLELESPDGQQFDQTGTETFTLDIPDARTGEWQYTITPVEVPYRNFPFTLTIGEKKSP